MRSSDVIQAELKIGNVKDSWSASEHEVTADSRPINVILERNRGRRFSDASE